VTLVALTPTALDEVPALTHHLRSDRTVAAPAGRVFDVLATGEHQDRWAEGFRGVDWHGSGPRGVGSVRDVRLRWITVRERFLAWEPGARFAFSADAMSLPLARRLVEDITLTPLDDDRCRLTWEVHLTPAAALTPLAGPLVARVFRPLFDGFAAGLARYAAAQPR
jgi:uncharacterized protein YndB with AHSA1/START domain